MKKLIETLVLSYKHYQSMRMTGEAKPSEAEEAESELSVSVIPVEESKKEEKTFEQLSALAELIVKNEKDKKISADGKERMTSKAKSSETEGAESQLSMSVIPVDESKEEEKNMMLSRPLAELVVESEEQKFQLMVNILHQIWVLQIRWLNLKRRQSKKKLSLKLCLFWNKSR